MTIFRSIALFLAAAVLEFGGAGILAAYGGVFVARSLA